MPPTHPDWHRALYPIALAAVKRGDFSHLNVLADDEHTARIVSNYAAADMMMTGRTLLLPMDEILKTTGSVPGVSERPLSSGNSEHAGADHAPAPASRDGSGDSFKTSERKAA